MGSRRYWVVVGVLAALVGLIVFIATVESTEPVASDAPPPTSGAPSTTIPAASSTTTTTGAPDCSEVSDECALLPPPNAPASTTLPPTDNGGPDWLWQYDPIPPVLSGQVIDLDDDGEPDVGLFGAAESPLIYPIEDDDIGELAAAQARIEQLTAQVGELEEVTARLQDKLVNNGGQVAPSDSPTPPEQAGDGAPTNDSSDTTPATTIKLGEGSQSSGLTPAQESLLLALISTGGVVLAGIGAPFMTAWGKRRFGTSDE